MSDGGHHMPQPSSLCEDAAEGQTFLDYAITMYVQVGEELYELPNRAWLRRRKAWKWRQHYAMRIADEMEALRVG